MRSEMACWRQERCAPARWSSRPAPNQHAAATASSWWCETLDRCRTASTADHLVAARDPRTHANQGRWLPPCQAAHPPSRRPCARPSSHDAVHGVARSHSALRRGKPWLVQPRSDQRIAVLPEIGPRSIGVEIAAAW